MTTPKPSAIGSVDQGTRVSLLSLSKQILAIRAATDVTFLAAIKAALDSRYQPIVGGVLLTDAAQTLTTATITAITWGTEVSDPDGWTSGGSATLTVPAGKGGRYLLAFTGTWNLGPTAHSVLLSVNGATVLEAINASGGTVLATSMFTTLRTLAAGDQLIFSVVQASGGNRDITSRLEIAPS